MNRQQTRVLAAVAALALGGPAGAATASLQKAWTFNAAARSGLEVDNLMGSVVVERKEGPGYHVTVTVTAGASDDAAARRLAEAIRFETRDSGALQSLKVIYPVRDYKAFYWPSAPRPSLLGHMGTEYLGEGVKLSGDHDGSADVHVDVRIRVPADARLTVRNPLGSLVATGVQGDLRFKSGSASQTLRDTRGEATLDTDSGDVRIERHDGSIAADTGSGGIEISGCKCRISADTGSGGVRVRASEGSLDADTGSGAVVIAGFQGSLKLDTGSGDVRVAGLSGATDIDAETGSGDLRIQGDLSPLRHLRAETGSGDVDLVTPVLPAMELVIDTGSGGIRVDAPTTSSRTDEDGRRIVTFGAGGGRGTVDTGSGSVTIRLSTTPQAPPAG